MREWTGKRYWLVGASEGLGAALARQLSRVGAELILSARSTDKLRALADELPGRVELWPMDVTAPVTAPERVDGLVYLAGAYWPMAATDWDVDKVQAMLDINLGGANRCIGAVLPGMVARGAGHIYLTGSLSAYRGLPQAVGYSASKAGLFALAETMALDLRGTGVEVQIGHPGFIKTQLTDKNEFDMIQMMQPRDAALHLFDHMNGGGFKTAFPHPFAALMRSTQLWPQWLFQRVFGRKA